MEFSKRISSVSPSITLAVDSKAKALKKQGVDLIGFGAGEPDYDTPAHIQEAAIKAIREGKTRYTASEGIPELRQAVADKFKTDNGLDYSAEDVVISCGGKHSIFNIISALCQEGDEVLIPSPYWVSYPEMAKAVGATPTFVKGEEASGFKIKPEALKAALTPKTKLFILNSPSNPTGAVYSKTELEALAEVLMPHKCFILSDDIYEKMLYGGQTFINIAMLGRELKNRTFIAHGVAKTYAMTGWRIGFAAGPKEAMKVIGRFQSNATSNPTTPAQYAALEALTGDQSCVEKFRVSFDSRRKLMLGLLRDIPGISCDEPNGAFYLFPNISSYFGKLLNGNHIRGSLEFADALLEYGKVAAVPGIGFGEDACIRFSYACSEAQINEGMKRFKQFVGLLK